MHRLEPTHPPFQCWLNFAASSCVHHALLLSVVCTAHQPPCTHPSSQRRCSLLSSSQRFGRCLQKRVHCHSCPGQRSRVPPVLFTAEEASLLQLYWPSVVMTPFGTQPHTQYTFSTQSPYLLRFTLPSCHCRCTRLAGGSPHCSDMHASSFLRPCGCHPSVGIKYI